MFTVFTPTFNRAHTLARVYDSLCAQTFTDFEWLIVDDGSTDGTSALVQAWIDEGRIDLRYMRQHNAGKHVAFNRGVDAARGELFLPLDSDDTCTPQALERFHHHWMSIAAQERSGFSGVTCLCLDEQGQALGGPLPSAVLDGPSCEIMSRLKRRDEMWGFHRTAVLREFPFPEIAGERFVPESLVWNRIARRYLVRFVNEALRHYHRSADSLSANMVQIRVRSPVATVCCYLEMLDLPIRLGEKLRAAANAWRFAFAGHRADLARAGLRQHPLYLSSMCLPGYALAWRDRHAQSGRGG